MSGQHTLGPWSASAPDGSYHDVIRIFADAEPADALPVAVCPQRNSAIMEVLAGSTNETTEAAYNARLIAAAPDLLAALEDMLSEFDADEFSSEGQMQTCAKASRAIAKARGAA